MAWAAERVGDAPRPDARVLLLGDAVSLAPSLAPRGWAAASVDESRAHAFEEGSVEAAVLVGVLERTEWDRWLLQRVHRALVPGGRLVLEVENAASLTSLDDVLYWIGGALKTARLRLTGKPGAFRRRRYRDAMLRTMLERLGYEIVAFDAIGTRGFRVVARRLPSVSGLDPARRNPEPNAYRAQYEHEHADFIATRDAWVRAHPAIASPRAAAPLRELDVAAYGGSSVLVLAPHPDDELIGCGGTSLRLIEAGAAVHVVHATDGSEAASLWRAPEELKRRVRLEEAERVAQAAGYASIECWREPNEAFRASETIVERLRATLARLRPRLVFVPFVSDVHADHRALAALLARALQASARDGAPLGADAEVLSYEVWGHVPANAFCDVTAEMPRLERLLWLYETAMKVDDYVHFCAERNHYNALAVAGRAGFVEAYFAAPATDYPELVRASGILP